MPDHGNQPGGHYTGAYVACALTTPTVFELDVTAYTVDAVGNVTWAGTFTMAADDGTHATDVSGSFRGISRVP